MSENLGDLIGSLNKAYIAYRKAFLKKSQVHGLYIGQPSIISYVLNHPGCTQTDIANELGVSSASIAFSTKRLQKAGFLMKQVNSLNLRCNKLYVTAEGKAILEGFQKDHDELNQKIFDGFSAEEFEQLASIAEHFNTNVEKYMAEG